MALDLGSDVLRGELAKQRVLAQFADRIARLQEQNPALLAEIARAHNINLGADVFQNNLNKRRSLAARRSRAAVALRKPQLAIRDTTAFEGMVSDGGSAQVSDKVSLPGQADKTWKSVRPAISTITVLVRRNLRAPGILGGGGIDVIEAAEVVEELPAGLRVTEDEIARVTEADEQRIIE